MIKCNKKRFRTALGARLALATGKSKKRHEIRYYFCVHCKSYHLTSQLKKLNKKCEEVWK